jgi:rhamnulokinase
MKKSPVAFLAFDLGAESGRSILAVLKNDKLTTTELNRFSTLPVQTPTGLHWNILHLWANLKEGLRLAGLEAKKQELPIISLGVDTWGVDCAYINKSGELVGLPYAYRDPRNLPAMDAVVKKAGREKVYADTGIQFMFFNTINQVFAQNTSDPNVLKTADKLLFIPDLLHFWFSGNPVVEATIASTSQMINPKSGKWAAPLLKSLGLPTHMLSNTVPAGTKVGQLRPEIAAEAGITKPIDVILPGSHDTASAVAAVPVEASYLASGKWAFLSSGTWSLMGAELDSPIVSPASLEAGFTNEAGVGGKIRYLKNIAGLWLVQEIKRDLAKNGQDISYADLTKLASQAKPFQTLIDPAHLPFASPGDMPAKIRAFAKATKQPQPKTPGDLVRTALESLALTYRNTLIGLEKLTGKQFDLLHIVGGGGQNLLLNQMTADALGKPVVVGPFEGTAIGNALTQAIGAGVVKDLTHLRQIVRNSTDLKRYEPKDAHAYAAQATRFNALLGK